MDISAFISKFGSPMDALFAAVALIYLITICLCFDSDKRSYATQMFLTILNVLLVVGSALTQSVWLLVLWCICLIINGYNLRNMHNKNED